MTDERRRGYRALVVEDDQATLRLVKLILEREGFVVEGVCTGAEAIELLKTVSYDLLIIDLILPVVSGEEVLWYLEEHEPATIRRVIMTTASPRKISSALLEKICRVLEKPFDVDRLILYARECLDDVA